VIGPYVIASEESHQRWASIQIEGVRQGDPPYCFFRLIPDLSIQHHSPFSLLAVTSSSTVVHPISFATVSPAGDSPPSLALVLLLGDLADARGSLARAGCQPNTRPIDQNVEVTVKDLRLRSQKTHGRAPRVSTDHSCEHGPSGQYAALLRTFQVEEESRAGI
jgi:hypothetical protein